MMNWVSLGSIAAFFAVAIGAFGAHGLKATLENHGTLAAFQTGAHYHFLHALALILLGVWTKLHPQSPATATGICFLVGITVFSGSLYALSVTGVKALGAITPIGGVAFLVGWALFAYHAWKAQ